MVTYRQVGRSMLRAARAMEREAKRAERRQIAYAKALEKQAILEAAAEAADEYDDLIEKLTNAHHVAFNVRDWASRAAEQRLLDPERSSTHEDIASAALANYRPNWFARIFGLEGRQRAKLALRVVTGRARDDTQHDEQKDFVRSHNEAIEFAERLMENDHKAVITALEEYCELHDLPLSIESIEVLFTSDGRIVAMADGLDLEDMPTRSVSLLQSGKASIKPLPQAKIQELHRDNICSSAVRVSLEFLKTLPIEEVEVVMHTDLLDRGTGHICSEPVLHLRVTRQAIETLNLSRTEAAMLVERLGGNFDWNRRDGFRVIKLESFSIPALEADAR